MATNRELALSVKRGKVKPEDVAPSRRDEVRRLVRTMSEADLVGPDVETPDQPSGRPRPYTRRVRAG